MAWPGCSRPWAAPCRKPCSPATPGASIGWSQTMNDLAAIDWRARFLASGDDADLPIIDAHQHYFDVENHYYPWLNDRPLRPFRYGDYSSICRNFLPADYRRLAGHHRVVQTVVIEGEWDPATPADEVAFVDALAQEESSVGAMVAQAWLDR